MKKNEKTCCMNMKKKSPSVLFSERRKVQKTAIRIQVLFVKK